jgi:uncharacterized protein
MEVEMRLYRGKIPVIAKEIVKTLTDAEAIEVDAASVPEVCLDVESIMKEYLRTERAVLDEAKTLLAQRSDQAGGLTRIKQTVAKRHKFALGEDAPDWILDQIIEVILHTIHIEEVWVEDHDLRRLMRPVLRRHMSVDEELDQEVRDRIKNLSEGSSNWEIRYKQEMDRLKALKGLTSSD